jgi:hypothetical protein
VDNVGMTGASRYPHPQEEKVIVAFARHLRILQIEVALHGHRDSHRVWVPADHRLMVTFRLIDDYYV